MGHGRTWTEEQVRQRVKDAELFGFFRGLLKMGVRGTDLRDFATEEVEHSGEIVELVLALYDDDGRE